MKLLRVPNDHCKGDSLARPFYWLSTLIGGRTICDVYKNKMEFQVDFLAHPDLDCPFQQLLTYLLFRFVFQLSLRRGNCPGA